MTCCRRLTSAFALSGPGLHSGRECVVKIEPVNCTGATEKLILATDNDHEARNEAPIETLALNGTGRGSDYIFADGTKIRTCEHVLAGLTGNGIWGAKLTVTGGEMPALDGCAAQITKMILEHSEPVKSDQALPKFFRLSVPVVVNEGERFVAAFPVAPAAPAATVAQDNTNLLHVTCAVSYNTPAIGTQLLDFYSGETGKNFREQIASARTFAMESEINFLRAQGLALGGTLENAILVGQDKDKIQCTGGLRWPDEFVRHKILDLIGDLAALGRPLCAHVVAVRGGHALHLRLVERLRRICGGN